MLLIKLNPLQKLLISSKLICNWPKLFSKIIHHLTCTFYKLKTIRYNNIQNKQQNFRKLKKNDIQNFNFHPADLQIVLALESEGISAISCNGAGVRNSGNCSLASCRRQLQLQLHFLGTRTHSYSYTHRYRCIHVRYFPSCPLRSVPMHARDAVFAPRIPTASHGFWSRFSLSRFSSSFNTEKLIRNCKTYRRSYQDRCKNRFTANISNGLSILYLRNE